ncbi:MAG: elongation factor P 5-aminopentanone reductase [Huintestinicola sp.]|uniref:elongation factor P 5-aminopentanone reductase n=1 Tax=Huintestinicola sp. TaxID=2981661 RepID=UPI003EFC6CBB
MAQTVIITGASRGIGRECAKQFAKAGYNVAAVYHKSEAEAQSLKAETGCEIFKCDCAVYSEVCEAVAEISSVFGGADVLINNAGIAEQALFSDITEAMWDNMFNVNVKSVYSFTHAALPYMIHNKYGRIINISSMWGQVGASCEVHYSAAKAAVIGFTKALAKEVGLSGVTVNCIAPGVIDTDMNAHLDDETMAYLREETPMNRIGTPEDIARAALFLAEKGSDFITGQIIGVNGGFII